MPNRLCFPINHSPPSVMQRRSFYSREFDAQAVERWLARLPDTLRNPVFAADVGTESGIARKKFRKSVNKLLMFSVRELGELKPKLVDLLPEDVYYDRNLYENKEKCLECKTHRRRDCIECANVLGQHVMFDIDPENIDCPNCGTLEERIRRKSMYGFCFICFKKAAIYTVKLHDVLVHKGYQRIETVYSGRGFHIYLEDTESYGWTLEQRDSIGKWVRDEEHIPIDLWVTRGGTKYARLPYSLHGLVGKIVTPISVAEVAKINPTRDWRLSPVSFVESSGKKACADTK